MTDLWLANVFDLLMYASFFFAFIAGYRQGRAGV